MAETIDMTSDGTVRDLSGEKRTLHIVYLLHALAPFTYWTLAAVAVLIGFFKRDNVRGTHLDSHYGWMAGAFWWTLFWLVTTWVVYGVLSIVTLGIGAVVLFPFLWIAHGILFIWYLYRVIRGWLALNEGKALS